MATDDNPEYSYHPSSIYENGRRTAATPYHHTELGDLTVILSQLIGKNTVTGQPEAIGSNRGGILTSPSGFCPDANTMIYYVRDSDVSTYPTKFVSGSTGKVKKIVMFPVGSVPGDMAQVSIFLYQAAPFPTKVTSIFTFEDDVVNYIDGSNELNYDYNSANQNKLEPN